MTVTYRSNSTIGVSGTAGTYPVAAPAGAAIGDLLVVVIQYVAITTTVTVTYPSAAWTEVFNRTTLNTTTGKGQGVIVATMQLTAAPDATYYFAFAGSSTATGLLTMVAATGGRSASVAYAERKTSGSGTLALPTLTAAAGDLVIEAAAEADSAGNNRLTLTSTPASTSLSNGGLSGQGSAYIAYTTQAAVGTSATGAWTVPSTSYGVTAVAVAVTGNRAPNAPTLNGPANNATIDYTGAQRFSWTFSDPDAADTQSKFDLRYSSNSGTSWTTVSGATANQYVDLGSGTFAAGSYQWQVRTYDAVGTQGPWSASSFFTAAAPPSGPSITYPVNGGTVNNPDRVTWSYSSQTDYQVRRVADNAGVADTSMVYYDSGDVIDATARSVPLSFPTNSRYEHIQVRVESGGLWSAWVDVRVLVSFTPPAAPTVTIGPGQPDLDGYVSTLVAAYVTPAASGSIPTATSALLEYSPDGGATVERSVRTINVTGADTFWTPASGVDYSVRVTVTADNGTSATSGWVNTPDSSGGTGGTGGGGTGGGGTTGNVAYGQGAYGVGPDD